MTHLQKKVNQLISQGEGLEIEFKESFESLSRSVFETICSFLNRKGGHILLGVADNGEIKGIKEDSLQLQLDILARDMNNPQIISPSFYISSEIVELKSKKVIYLYVPESSQVHLYKGSIYDRNEDGDFKLVNQQLIANLYLRKQTGYTENKVFPYLEMNDFELSKFDLVRNLSRLTRSDHPWVNMTNEEILKSARLFLKDQQTGLEGYTLAAALLFGKENTIASVLPHYKTDALCRKVDIERYDDRDDIRCNLIESYSRLLAFVRKHLPDRFYLEGNQRISIREAIFREVIANILVHREFSNAFPATLTIYKDTVKTENWNKPYMQGNIQLSNLKPHPKNPTLANFFKQLGWVEELGSGVRKMFKYCPLYVKDALPEIEEGDIFKIKVRFGTTQETDKVTTQETIKKATQEISVSDGNINELSSDQLFDNKKKVIVTTQETDKEANQEIAARILVLIKQQPKISRMQIAKELGSITENGVKYHLAKLTKNKIIKHIGSTKSGYWVIVS